MRWSTCCSSTPIRCTRSPSFRAASRWAPPCRCPRTDILNRRRKEMLDMIAVMMAGRIAEEIVSGDISSGAAGDIQQATNMARAMVCQWGMSDRLGMVQYGDDDEYVFLGREMSRAKVYSEFTAQEIDGEVKRIIDDAYKTAKDILTTQSRQAGADRQVPARIRNPRRPAGRGNRPHRQVYAAAARAAGRASARRAGRHAAARDADETRSAQAARIGHSSPGDSVTSGTVALGQVSPKFLIRHFRPRLLACAHDYCAFLVGSQLRPARQRS